MRGKGVAKVRGRALCPYTIIAIHKALPGDAEKNCLPRLGGFSQIRSHIYK